MMTSETCEVGLPTRTSETGAKTTPGASLPVTVDPVLRKVDVMGPPGNEHLVKEWVRENGSVCC